MKARNLFLSALLAVSLLAAGCGSTSYDMAETAVAVGSYNEAKEEVDYETADIAENPENGTLTGTTLGDNVQTGRKLIRTFDMTIETREFDGVLEGIKSRVKELGGYIESASLDSGSEYYSRYNRYSDLMIRVPSEKLDQFVENVKDSANVTYVSEYTDDITLKYVDTESRKLALETERDRLLELLEKAETVEDIITIESRLSEVRYELESYTSQLRTYDNQIDYSTVNLSIHEVDREVKAEPKGFWEEVKEQFEGSLYELGQGIRGFTIWFLGSLPYLICIVLAAGIVLWGTRKIRRRRKEKKTEPKE